MSRLPPPFAIRMLFRIWNGLHGLADKLLPPEPRVLFLVGSFTKTGSIQTAAKLRIADHLAHGAKGIGELAKSTSSDTDSLYRLMRALASEGIFRELSG